MWKKRAAARGLESQAVAELSCVDTDKQQIIREIFRRGRFGLLHGRKMNATAGSFGNDAALSPA
jgi:hypothetical protein